MSETQSQYETVVIQGRWSKYHEEGEWCKYEIDIPGKNYPVKASSKRSETKQAMMAVRDKDATFTLAEKDSANINPHTDRPYKDRYISKVEEGFVGEPTRSDSGGTRGGSTAGGREDLSPEAVARIEENQRRDIMSRCWAHTISALQHTFRADEEADKFFTRLQSFQRRIYYDIAGEWGLDRDDSYLPEPLRDPRGGETSSSPSAAESYDRPPPPVDDDIPF